MTELLPWLAMAPLVLIVLSILIVSLNNLNNQEVIFPFVGVLIFIGGILIMWMFAWGLSEVLQ